MVNPATGPKRVVLRANRDTLVLVAAAGAVTLALASSIHSRGPEVAAETPAVVAQQPQQTQSQPDAPPQQDWAGHLTEADATQTASVEPMSSASLVVPKSALALPAVPKRAKSACDAAAGCSAKSQVPRSIVMKSPQPSPLPAPEHDRSLISRLNPLSHLPDARALGRPFVYAGNTISGWFDRL